MVHKITNQPRSLEQVRAINEDSLQPKLQFPQSQDQLLMKELLSDKSSLVFGSPKTPPHFSSATVRSRHGQPNAADRQKDSPTTAARQKDSSTTAERSRVEANDSERRDASGVTDEKGNDPVKRDMIYNRVKVAGQAGAEKEAVGEGQQVVAKDALNSATGDQTLAAAGKKSSTEIGDISDKAGRLLGERALPAEGADKTKGASDRILFSNNPTDVTNKVKAGSEMSKEDFFGDLTTKSQPEIRQLDLPVNVARVPVAETVVIDKLPTGFSEQVKLVAEYVQLSVANAKQRQSICIKLQPTIMPDAQLFLARRSNQQLDITMVSQRDATLVWFNGLAPRLASYLGGRLNEPINVTVKNGTAADQGFARQQQPRQQEK